MGTGGDGMGDLTAFRAETERVARQKPRRKLRHPAGHTLVAVDLVLTENELALLDRIAAVEFPRTPSGALYRGLAASAIFRQGLQRMRERWDEINQDSMEDLYGCISEREAEECGLSIIDLRETRGAKGDLGEGAALG